jgi:hypothetical protein
MEIIKNEWHVYWGSVTLSTRESLLSVPEVSSNCTCLHPLECVGVDLKRMQYLSIGQINK